MSSTNFPIDLRSDTVTKPTEEMLHAMINAEVGDDVLGDDPTVTRLEQLAARLMGKEAAVFVPSGTMGNQMAIATHTQRGEAILAEENAHVLYYEVAGPAIFAGVITRNVPSINGIMSPDEIEKKVMKASIHTPGTTLLCLENSHNRAGGTVTPVSTMKAYRGIADKHNLKIHLDGARVFNAATALNVNVNEIADQVDSVNFCLSKGLRAPIGSVLCGSSDFIESARIWRKRLGGGMRQAGILAAAGIYSLENYIGRLSEDHENAKRIAKKLNKIPGLKVELDNVQTNIVMVDVEGSAEAWSAKLKEHGVWCFPFGESRLRLVLHADVNTEMVDEAVTVFESLSAVTV